MPVLDKHSTDTFIQSLVENANVKLSKDQILTILSCCGAALSNVDDLQNDKDCVLAAVIEDGTALRYASNELKTDMEVVLSALRQNLSAVKYITKTVVSTPEVFFILEHNSSINKTEWPLVKRALLERPDYFLNPEPCIGALTDDVKYPYLMLAQYALNKDMAIEPEEYPELML